MRVLHAPANIGNQAWTLSRAERGLGVDSELVTTHDTWLGLRQDRSLGGRTMLARLGRLGFGLSAPFRYDVLHMYFGRSLFGSRRWPLSQLAFQDVRLARRLGKRIVFTLQGCDVRLAVESNRRNMTTGCAADACTMYDQCVASRDSERRQFIQQILPLADRVFFLNPELAYGLPDDATFLPYANVDPQTIDVAPPSRTGPVRVVHAPTSLGLKGTRFVREAVEALKSRFEIEYIEVTNLPHADAMERYRSADVAIDQLLMGWYGGFAVEMMAMGKPVVCYIRQADLGCVPGAMTDELPIVRAEPRDLTERLVELIERREDWSTLSQASRRFVERWHNPRTLARAMVEVYSGRRGSFLPV